MKTKFLCPECQNTINVGDDIVLVAKTKNGLKGIIFLHAELGNYTSRFNDDFTLVEGNIVTFCCPICNHNLTNHKHQNLAHLVRIDENGKEAFIVFSKIYGEQCTYKIDEKQITESYGDHLGLYTNPDWFLWF